MWQIRVYATGQYEIITEILQKYIMMQNYSTCSRNYNNHSWDVIGAFNGVDAVCSWVIHWWPSSLFMVWASDMPSLHSTSSARGPAVYLTSVVDSMQDFDFFGYPHIIPTSPNPLQGPGIPQRQQACVVYRISCGSCLKVLQKQEGHWTIV